MKGSLICSLEGLALSCDAQDIMHEPCAVRPLWVPVRGGAWTSPVGHRHQTGGSPCCPLLLAGWAVRSVAGPWEAEPTMQCSRMCCTPTFVNPEGVPPESFADRRLVRLG